MKAPLPTNEAARLNDLYQYEILDTDPEQAFDDLTRLVAHICGTPAAMISLIDADRLWFKSKVGLDASEIPRDIAFCNHTILKSDLFLVPDAQQDIRFLDNPLVTSGPMVRFYAGAPLITSDNIAVGALCTIDYVPRELTPEQKQALEILGRQVVTQLKLRRNLAVVEEALQQRQQSEEALRESQEQYRRLVDFSPATIAVLSEGKFDYINAAGANFLGAASPKKLIGKPILDFVHPDNREILQERGQLLQVKENQANITQQQFVRLDGQAIDVEVTEIPITYLGKPATQVVFKNISDHKRTKEALLRAMVAELAKQELEKEFTECKRVEEALKTQHEFLRQVIDLNPSRIYVKDWEGRFIFVNEAFADFYGTTVEKIVGKSDANFNSNKEEVERVLRQDREVMETVSRRFTFEETLTNLITHNRHLFQTIKMPFLSSDSKPRHLLGISTDITDRR